MRSLLLLAFSIVALQAQPPPATAKPKPARVIPPPRIAEFVAQPAALQPGQTAMLRWVVENPNSVTLEPGIGAVTARGSKQIKPSATTTYTLTVAGPNNATLTQVVKVTVAGTREVSSPEPKQIGKKDVPRMPDGKPDLSGVYNSSSFIFAGGQVKGANDPIAATLKPGAEKFKVVRGPTDSGLYSDCMPTGVPLAYFVPYQWQIVQALDKVVIVYEYPHLFRIIPTHGGPHQADPDPTWMGDSIGHWEGDTFVVDIVGFNQKTELPGGFKHTESLHVVERFNRIDYDSLDYEATIEDTAVFEKPWKIHRVFPLRPDLERVDEFVCENNRDYKPLFK